MKYNRENTEKLLQDIFQKKILVKGVVSNIERKLSIFKG